MNEMMTSTMQMQTVELNKDLFTRWVDYVDASEGTRATYERAIKQFAEYLKAMNVTTPTREDIKNYRDWLKQSHKATTVQNYLCAVKMFFKWLSYNDIYKNVAEGVRGVRVDAGFKKDYLTSNQTDELLLSIDRSTLKGKRDFAMLSLMVTTGLRTISIIRANIEDIRTAGDAVMLFHQGKGHDDKDACVELIPSVERALREYLSARGEKDGKAALFASTANRNGGGRMTTKSVSRVAKEQLRGIGLDSDRLTAHSLRHTAATLSILQGSSTKEVQQMLGHTKSSTTELYNHALTRANNHSERRIGACLTALA